MAGYPHRFSVDSPTAIPVPQSAVDDLTARLRNTQWAPDWPGIEPWAAGTDPRELRRLAQYWADGFDWRVVESVLRALPSVEVCVNEVPVHAFYFAGERPGSFPLMLVNGWPSTSFELVDLARRLSNPSSFGGRTADAFTVVVPSLPGFPSHRNAPVATAGPTRCCTA